MKELINFKNQNLNLDYLTLNIPNSVGRILEFAEIFFRYGFNSKVFYVATNESQTILEDKKLFHTLTFRLESDSWNKEKLFIQFSGDNSRRLYFLITNGSFSISQLNCQNIKIGRIDIQFIRPNKTNDIDVDEFLEKSLQVSKDGIPQRDENDNIQTLAIGKRENAYYIRIYKMDSALKFELEIKKRPAQHLGLLLLNVSYQEFEDYISKSFFKHFWKSIFLETCFTDWLLYWYRKSSQKPNFNGFITTYFKHELTDNKELLFNFLRTLSYIHKHGKKQQKFEINDQQQTFHEVTFRLIDFIRYVKVNEKNHRQRNRMVDIFKQFQDLHQFQLKTFQRTLDDNFILNDDCEFTSVVLIPYFNVQKKGNIWNVTLLVANQFYDYNFPFQFNHYFFHWKNTKHFEVKTQVIQILGQTTLKKKLDVQQFMKPFDKVSNVQKTTVKKILIESIEQEIQNKFLKPKFKIIQKDNSVKYLDQIKPINITKARFIYFYENINIRDLLKQI